MMSDLYSRVLESGRPCQFKSILVSCPVLYGWTLHNIGKKIAFGFLEDNPWEENGKRTRWDFKDWGAHSENLRPNSIVRLEGVSVNEWNEKRSININRGSRVTILREGGPAVPTLSDEPILIEKASENEGYVNLLVRIISLKPDVITKRDGSGTIDIFRGTLADSSGKISFLSWVPLEHEVGDLVKIEGAMIRKFRETPEVNVNDRTKIEKFHDSNFASIEDLSKATTSQISDLRNGMKDVIVDRHFASMKEGAIISNTGHYDCEINIEQLQSMSSSERTIRENNVEYTLPDGRRIFILADGRLVNLAAAEGHPSEVMDMSFANQYLALCRLAKEGKSLGPIVYDISLEQDQGLAKTKLATLGFEIDVLTADQVAYLSDYTVGT